MATASLSNPQDLGGERIGRTSSRPMGRGAHSASTRDGFLHEALSALDHPAWASRRRKAAGGPGSGYDAALLVLDEGHTLEELAAWLATANRRFDGRVLEPAPFRTAGSSFVD
jgi:hypothetical protein